MGARVRRGLRKQSRGFRITAVAGLVTGALVAGPATAVAGWSVGPVAPVVEAARGATAEGVLQISMGGERGRKFVTAVQELAQNEDGSFGYREPGKRDRAKLAATWVTFGPGGFFGKDSGTRNLPYRVVIPPNAPAGDHVVALTTKRLPKSGGSVGTAEAIAIRLRIRVAGTIAPAVRISPITAPSVSSSFASATGEVRITNTGNTVVDFSGENPGSLEVAGTTRKLTGVLIPGASRAFSVTGDDQPLLGRSNARATVRIDNATVVREAASWWSLPWQLVAAGLLLAAAAHLVRTTRRRPASVVQPPSQEQS